MASGMILLKGHLSSDRNVIAIFFFFFSNMIFLEVVYPS